jgi:hypothetical protein
MIPTVIKKVVMPISTCFLTGSVLLIFTLNYLTMTYWYATAVEAGNVACWAYLLWLAIVEPPQSQETESA